MIRFYSVKSILKDSILPYPTINQINQNVSNLNLSNNEIIPNIKGYIKSINSLKKLTFIDLFDGTTSQPLKIVLPTQNISNTHLQIGQAISLSNLQLKLTPQRSHPFELFCNDPLLLSPSSHANDLSFLQKKQNLPLSFLRSNNLHKYKTEYLSSFLRFRSKVQTNLIDILQRQDFHWVNPPIITTNDTEGNNQTFKLIASSLEQNNLNLTVSTQLHLEILALSLSNVFSFSPIFRAEQSDTSRHLSEFYMLELESTNLITTDHLIQSIKLLIQKLVSSFSDALLPSQVPMDQCDQLQTKDRWNLILTDSKWLTVTYSKAIEILNANNFSIKWGQDLSYEMEKFLTKTHFNNSFLFITKYPKSLKPFYMKQSIEDPNTVECFDLLFPSMGEIAGGSIREDNYDVLKSNVHSKDNLDWYLELRSTGSTPHGGFGVGFERLLAYLYGLQNVKDAIPFYRAIKDNITL
ncbi:hypothetical protein KAFR_0F01390 [Kazachstania africana CBS 2517]|uniref:asparagine--tRNA ligase n=1 Tax=Kazachstania africana (strain ATCC 22294 / BCRC 22015 / CBS 2517 / CECT 1963 / NBRC 1671 / NRRL Y-8276) TaxID=1071382 RepID=H2AWI5_KAZAF|nr:hypothetical protein KAFR_0F01390 [Kazachstania africana CBS 2517]CCF58735.1 hypothetical protein KAFR_0F01390 [Kazachstania africana CBS 2517]